MWGGINGGAVASFTKNVIEYTDDNVNRVIQLDGYADEYTVRLKHLIPLDGHSVVVTCYG